MQSICGDWTLVEAHYVSGFLWVFLNIVSVTDVVVRC